MGPATVRAVIDTLGRVEEKSIEVLETPDSGFIGPLTTMTLIRRSATPRRCKRFVSAER